MRGDKKVFFFVLLFVSVSLSLTNFVSSTYMYCNDTDGGQIVNIFGSVGTSYMSVPNPGEITWSNDGCFVGTSPIVSCTGDTCFLREYYCNGVPASWDANYTLVSCTSLGYAGCSDGECYGSSAPVANCSDGIKNGDETYIDCGGPLCSQCDNGESCSIDEDCSSNFCSDGECARQVESSIEVELGGNDPGDHSWNSSSYSYYNVMMQIEISAVGEDMDLLELNFSTSGTGNDAVISSVTIYEDSDEDGELDIETDMSVGWGAILHDNGDFNVNMFEKDIDEGDTLTLLIVYGVNSGTPAGTFTLKFEGASARGKTSYETFTATGNFENTKTVNEAIIPNPFSHCYNWQLDSVYGETGIDCGGVDCISCPEEIPSCIPFEMSCPFEVGPLCDNINGVVYICMSGMLLPSFLDYETTCGSERCYEGDLICNHDEMVSMVCTEGQWIYSDILNDYLSRCRIGTNCDWSDNQMYCDGPDSAYRCNEYGEYENFAPQNGECSDLICNYNEIMCDYDSESLMWCDGYEWFPADEEGEGLSYAQGSGPNGATEVSFFESFCGTQNPTISCVDGEKRCGILDGKMELCKDNKWELISNSEDEFNQVCSGIDCRANWFKCNPFTEEVSFCSGITWGAPRKTNYDNYCIKGGITNGQGPQIITGEVVNNTVVVYKYLDETQKKKKFDFGKPLYWIIGGGIVVLIILISLIVYFATKASAIKNVAGLNKRMIKRK